MNAAIGYAIRQINYPNQRAVALPGEKAWYGAYVRVYRDTRRPVARRARCHGKLYVNAGGEL